MDFSRAFYNLDLNDSKSFEIGTPLESYLDQAVRCGDLPGEVISWYNGVCWYPGVVEDTAVGQPVIEHALSELRSYMYTMVKKKNDKIVTEYGRTPLKTFDKIKV